VAVFLQEEAADGDIFIAHFPDPALDYYLLDVPMPRRMFPATVDQSAAETEESLVQLAREYERLWLVPYHKSVWDRENVVPRWLANNNLQEQTAELHRMELNAFRPMHSSDDIVLPLNGGLHEQLKLEGAYVTVDGRPVDFNQSVAVDAGSELQITLIWAAGREPAGNYTVFIHLLDENGILLAQHDGIPVDGTRPTATWQEGELIIDVHNLVVPEGVHGTGQLVTGIYDSESLQRQELLPGQSALQILKIQFN
jgi:hypothetical protein